MYILGFLLILLATYVLYLRSDKTTHRKFWWEERGKWSRKSLSIVSGVLFSTSAVVFCVKAGLFGGFCFGMITFFFASSVFVIIRPLMTAEKAKAHARK